MAKHRRKSRRRKKSKKKAYAIIVLLTIITGIILYFSIRFIYYNIEGKQIQEARSLAVLKSELSQFSSFGIDISQYQKTINWDSIRKEELDFIITRATAGKNYLDPQFKRNWKNIKDKDIVRGAYHYYRPNENSEEQANFFINNVNLEIGDLPPVLDIERYSRVQSLHMLKTGLLNWLEIIEDHYQTTPIIYTYKRFYQMAIADDHRFQKYPVWIAWYNTEEDPSSVSKDWIFWQFTDNGKVSGIDAPVDVNAFYGEKFLLNFLRIKENKGSQKKFKTEI